MLTDELGSNRNERFYYNISKTKIQRMSRY
jgi:hypothetical protein